MPLNNLFANCQSNAGSRVFCLIMEPLKDHKYLFEEPSVNSNPISHYRKMEGKS